MVLHASVWLCTLELKVPNDVYVIFVHAVCSPCRVVTAKPRKPSNALSRTSGTTLVVCVTTGMNAMACKQCTLLGGSLRVWKL